MTEPARPPRPILLAVMMLVCTVMGATGIASGCGTIRLYQGATIPERPLVAGVDAAEQEATRALERAELDIRYARRSTLLPIGVANLLLSGLLFFATTRVIGRRPGARALVIQALLANAALAIVEYTLTRDVRGQLAMAFADHVPRSALRGTGDMPEEQIWSFLDAAAWMVFRVKLTVTLGMYGLAYLSLGTAAARGYLGPDGGNEGAADEG